MYQVANLGRGSTEIEDLERLPADWERAKFSHRKSVLYMEILLNHSYNSLLPATLVFVK